MNYLVIDFGGTLVKYSVMDNDCQVLEKGEATAPSSSKEAFLQFIAALLAKLQVPYEIEGIAISMPGIIDEKSCYLHTAGTYLPMYGVDLREELARYTSLPVSVENDGKCAALAEVWRGGLQRQNDGAVIIIGTGIAGGIIKGRRVHKGKSLSAGEFSFLLLDGNDTIHSTALTQCSTSMLLYKMMRRKGIDLAKSPIYKSFGPLVGTEQKVGAWNEREEYRNGLDGYQFFSLLEQRDNDAMELYEQFTRSIARMILNLQITFAPEKVLIGGGISRQERLIPDIRKQYEALKEIYCGLADFRTEIDGCRFLNEANQIGALYNFLMQHDKLRHCMEQ